MKFEIVPNIPKLHVTPLAEVSFKNFTIVVRVDDENEDEFRLKFTTFQGLKITTSDCFSMDFDPSYSPQTAYEIKDSPWIKELKENLSQTDEDATFMEKARHYLIPCQDEYIEVVAWDVTVERG